MNEQETQKFLMRSILPSYVRSCGIIGGLDGTFLAILNAASMTSATKSLSDIELGENSTTF